MALKEATKENIYLNNTVKYLTLKLQLYSNNNNILIILVDNQGSLKLAENPEFYKRTKYIDIIYHFIQECINENKIKVGYIPTKEQLADRFTKGLDNTKHITLIENIWLKESKILNQYREDKV